MITQLPMDRNKTSEDMKMCEAMWQTHKPRAWIRPAPGWNMELPDLAYGAVTPKTNTGWPDRANH